MNQHNPHAPLSDNLRKAKDYLQRLNSDVVPHKIAGKPMLSEDTFDVLDPSDNSILCKVASGGKSEVDGAERAAEDAFKVWKNVPGEKRRMLLHRIADRIEARARKSPWSRASIAASLFVIWPKPRSEAPKTFGFMLTRRQKHPTSRFPLKRTLITPFGSPSAPSAS